ncbi:MULTISPECIES: acetolactate synthase small subunit [Enterococcus]|uniref:Acetolactate synthase small subunit n=1 Tax=Enterococcus sulfureus ATCC 49903 TaxID=1140003 RepID=S0KM35_9ENTE|nr:acetolactate synthase small subunit [Enterococcus sulfureus]EOT45787.1 acetolactate synthase, small subunit [Enterococcus sulfureus ATCC 49903]EOT82948.1 acetolactate synthase, small subunit [Enterococcus sulfureus ATCC 49903]
MRRILNATVRNQQGVLNRFTGILTRRQVNIESISVGETIDPIWSRITIVIQVDHVADIQQVIKQLHKMIDVKKVVDITDQKAIERELALIRVHAPLTQRAAIQTTIEPFRASIVDAHEKAYVIQLVGDHEKIEACIENLRPFGIVEIARTGVVGLTRTQTT